MATENEIAPPAKRRRTWLYVIGGLLMICMMVGLTLVVGGIVIFNRHVHTDSMAPDTATKEFEREAARFASSQPLIELGDRGHTVVHRTPDRPRRQVEALHLLVYDTNDEQMVRITVPGWLLRLAPSSNRASVRIDGVEGLDGTGENPVSLEDLERHGPGLVVDSRQRPRGDRVLAWID